MKPTDEQIKEFWERCGFELIEFANNPGHYYRQTPHGQMYKLVYPFDELPPIDLNNLLKYAVPAVQRVLRYDLLHSWIDDVTLRNEDPALALFWAIWEVMEVSLSKVF